MLNRETVLIGGGGHTRVLIGMLSRNNRAIRGIVTNDPELVGTAIMDVPVLGLENGVVLDPTEITLVNAVGNKASRNGSNLAARRAVYERYHKLGFTFYPLFSEHAIIQPHVTLSEGVQVMPGAVIQPGAMIGENVIINTAVSVDHDVVIYPHAHIAPGATLCGHVVVGEETHVGAGAVVIQGIKIGKNCVIGAGAVVTRDVPDNSLVRAAASEQTKLVKVKA